MLEYEKKILLTQEEFDCLSKSMNFCNICHQTNHYYDDANNSYHSKGTTLRIREKNGKFAAQIKMHGCPHKDCSKEYSTEVENTNDTSFFGSRIIEYKGSLSTYRSIAKPTNNISVMLDKNDYLGYTDYELEIEYDSDAEDEAIVTIKNIEKYLILLRLVDMPGDFEARVGKSPNKSERFFARLSSKNTEMTI